MSRSYKKRRSTKNRSIKRRSTKNRSIRRKSTKNRYVKRRSTKNRRKKTKMKMQGEDQDVVVYDSDDSYVPIPEPDTIPEGVFDDLVYPEDDPLEKTKGSTAVHRKMVQSDKKMIEEAMEQEDEFMGPRLRQIWDVGFSHTKGKPYFINRETEHRQFKRPTKDLYGRSANPPPVKLQLKQPSEHSRQKEEMLRWLRKFHGNPPPGLVKPIPEVLSESQFEFLEDPGIMIDKESQKRYKKSKSSSE